MTDPQSLSQAVEVYQSDFNSLTTSLYAALSGYVWDDGWRLEGCIEGPFCELSDTLAATIALIDQGPGDGLLAAARMPDPCAWSADLPATYKLTTTLTCNGEPVQQTSSPFSFRATEIRSPHFYRTDLNGNYQRFVMRGADQVLEDVLDSHTRQYRDEGLCCVVTNPTAADCLRALQQGVWILAVIDCPASSTVAQTVNQLNRWACVAACVLRADVSLPTRTSSGMRVPVGCWLADVAAPIPDWAEFLMANAASGDGFNQQFQLTDQPVIAAIEASFGDAAEARTACAQLQKQLAPLGDYAGYTVFNNHLPFS
jgi:hypothetical protein